MDPEKQGESDEQQTNRFAPAAEALQKLNQWLWRQRSFVEALATVGTNAVTVDTPLGPSPGRTIGRDVVVVPVLRAGLGMLDAVLELVPGARVGHIGLQRDEITAVASQYYSKLPARLDSSKNALLCIPSTLPAP